MKLRNGRSSDLLITVNHVAGMQVLCCPEQLVEDVLLVNFFEDIAAFDNIVKVRVYISAMVT